MKMIRVELIFPLVPERSINHVTDSRVHDESYLSHDSPPPLVSGPFDTTLFPELVVENLPVHTLPCRKRISEHADK